jgi:conjugal transfer mating pair stabilization protein TraG
MRNWQDDRTGDTYSTSAFGREAVSLLSNSGFASRMVSRSISSSDVAEANKAAESARSDAVSANAERAAVLTSIFERGASKGASWRNSDGTSVTGYEDSSKQLSQLATVANSVGNEFGVSSNSVANLGIRAGLAAGGLGLAGGKSFQDGLSEADKKIVSSLSQESINDFKRFGDRVTRDQGFVRALVGDQNEANRMSAQLAERTSRAHRAEAVLSDRVGVAQRISQAHENRETISIDMARDPAQAEMMLRYSQQYGRNSAAFFVMANAELARAGLPPTPTFSDGMAVPQSFRDVEALHRSRSASPDLSQNVDSANAQNRARVAGARFSSGGGGSAPQGASSTRAEVQQAAARIKGEVSGATGGFEANHELKRDPHGNLTTDRSQVLDVTRRAAAEDAAATEQVKKTLDGVVDEAIADPGAAFQKYGVDPAKRAWDNTFGGKK